MKIEVTHQFIVFALALTLGGIFGVIYDLLRILQRAFNLSRASITVQDIIFFILFGFASFLFVMQYTDGYVRVYALIAHALGWLIYFMTIGKIIYGILGAVIDLVKKSVDFLNVKVFKPVGDGVTNFSKQAFSKGRKAAKDLSDKVSEGAGTAVDAVRKKFKVKPKKETENKPDAVE